MTRKEKKMLDRVKVYAFKLRDNGQIPYELYCAIVRLNYESSTERVERLKDLTDKYTRVGGFYIRHPEGAMPCIKELKLLGLDK